MLFSVFKISFEDIMDMATPSRVAHLKSDVTRYFFSYLIV